MTTTSLTVMRQLVADRYDLSEPLSLNDAAELLREVVDLQADLSLVRSGLEEQLAANMETDVQDTPWGRLERHHKPVAPKWDSRRLAYVVAEKIPPTNEDGEPLPPGEAIDRTVEELLAVSGISNASHGWRKTALKERGIDWKSYCEVDGWRTTVRFA